ncbi:small s [Fusarium agapanthi]|uniref:Small s n=1 Tax=Fusarium agapanthi TaxID=1803897 RepID=A0A9P5BET6_9HYPO|nr:small s [Fusarium agapanthi]
MGLYDTGSHKSYHDWSQKTLKGLLRQILEAKGHTLRIFVDGLDEVANDDGLDKLTEEIEEVLQSPGIKICVSSRPEASVCMEETQFEHNRAFYVRQPALGQIAFAEMPDRLEVLLKYGDRIYFNELQEICDMTRDQIEIRCGGPIQIRKLQKEEGISSGDHNDLLTQQVAFIHRTAHDFFTETEAGRSILRTAYGNRDLEVAACAAKGLLCLHRIVANRHGVSAEMIYFISQIGG